MIFEPPILPQNTAVEYLNEGAANIVYHISIPPQTPEPEVSEEYGSGTPPPSEYQTDRIDTSVFSNTLLRLRKDTPTTLPVEGAQALWTTHLRPLIPPEHLITQSLITLPPELIATLNASLATLDACPTLPRAPKRRGTRLAPSSHGLLVTSMTPRTPSERVLEFKPKWLLPSPSAPIDAVRCRQCANAASKKAAGQRDLATFCPLDLVSSHWSSEEEDVDFLAAQIMRPNDPMEWLDTRVLAHWIKTNSLLPLLRDLQGRFDPVGISNIDFGSLSEKEKMKMCIAMTLRDCTVFLRFERAWLHVLTSRHDDYVEAEWKVVEARIGDLDVKSPDKWEYWKGIERSLVDGGWYAGAEEVKMENRCRLGRTKV